MYFAHFMDAVGALSRLQKVEEVPVDYLRLFPLGYVPGVVNNDQCGTWNSGVKVAADLRREESILFAPEDQGRVPDFLKPGRKALFPKGQAVSNGEQRADDVRSLPIPV
jgi:hypothetical protein